MLKFEPPFFARQGAQAAMAQIVPGRFYKNFTTESYRQAMLVAWMAALPYVASLGPEVARIIADFLLIVTPAPPPMRTDARGHRRRLAGALHIPS